MKFTTGLISVLNLAAAVLGSSVVELTEKNFQSVVVDSKIPTIVDVYASWCGHCKRLAPVYDELADAFAHAKGKVQVVKIDGDIHRKISKSTTLLATLPLSFSALMDPLKKFRLDVILNLSQTTLLQRPVLKKGSSTSCCSTPY